MRIVVPSSGTYYHIESIEGARYAKFFDVVTTPENLSEVLEPQDCLFVPCRTPFPRMAVQREIIAAHLNAGGTVVAMGESNSEKWLSDIRFHSCPTNWWWWTQPGEDLGVEIADASHPLMKNMSKADVTWHLHGHFDVPQGAQVLAVNKEAQPILYVDESSTNGRLIVTSLDPMYHHGSHFMPATTRFLDRFLPNLKEWLHG
jgi:hypothetical protein